MRAIITDQSAIEAISPIDLASYLRSRGWRRDCETESDLAQTWIWEFGNGEQVDAIIPQDRLLRDFRRRVAETLQTLAVIEHRSQLEIFSDIQQVSTDVIRWRWIQDSADDGTVPLEQGQQFISQIRSQLLAAACSAVHPQQFFASRKPPQATEYLRQARLGQSERGSYVVTVHSPVPPMINMEGFQDESDPFERRVTLTLQNALQALRVVASDAVTSDIRSTEKLSERGISANLCESVAAMLGMEKSRRDVEVGFSFATSRPASGNTSQVTRFSTEFAPIIGEIGKALRESATREDFELIGFVTDLSRGPHQSKGIAVVQGPIDENFRRVEMEVGTSDYDTVLTIAHRDRLMIRCEGELQKVKGKSYRLLNARGFEIPSSD